MTQPRVSESWLVLGILIFSALSTIVGIFAMVTNHWHLTDSAYAHVRRGLFQVCTAETIGGSYTEACKSHETISFCGHQSTEIRSRIGGAASMAISSVAIEALTAVVTVAAWCCWRIPPKVLFVLSASSICAMGVCITVTMHTWDAWYFCNQEFCAYTRTFLGNGGEGAGMMCLSSVGYSFMLACLASLLGLGTLFCSAMYVRFDRLGMMSYSKERSLVVVAETDVVDPASAGDATRTALRGLPPGEGDLRGSSAPTQMNGLAPASRPDDAQPLQHEDYFDAGLVDGGGFEPQAGPQTGDTIFAQGSQWAYHASHGMWWSEQEGLYLDSDTMRFYDPSSKMWYDPNTRSWTEE